MHKSKNYQAVMDIIQQYAKGGQMESSTKTECATSSNDYATFFLKCLWIRDQAHIFH